MIKSRIGAEISEQRIKNHRHDGVGRDINRRIKDLGSVGLQNKVHETLNNRKGAYLLQSSEYSREPCSGVNRAQRRKLLVDRVLGQRVEQN